MKLPFSKELDKKTMCKQNKMEIMQSRLRRLSGTLLLVCASAAFAAPLKIGSVDSLGGGIQSTQAYQRGAELAVAEINASGGVLGRQVQLVVREDRGGEAEAVRNAEALIRDDKVDVLSGTMLSNVALAVAKTAAARKKLFVVGDALSDAITLDKGNRYTFRLRPSTYMQAAMLAEAAAKLPVRRWAIIAPNYEYGQSAVANFKLLLKERRPDVEFVAEQWPAMGKINADEAVRSLQQARPEAIFNATFGNDLLQFVEAGSRQGLFASSRVLSMSAGETLGNLQGQYPAISNWFVIGYPIDQITLAEHQRFRDAYAKRFNEQPHLYSIFGYSTIMAIAGGVKKSGSLDGDKLVAAMRGLSFETPVGMVSFRAQDQQSSFGAFIGTLSYMLGQDPASDWRYLDGLRYLPTESYVKNRRPSSALH
jgi:branched-chain amino acid transport system substrate-binding protein